ncbi:chorismate mutase [Tissierellaceae bacterium HCP3S3_D8]
MNMISIRGAITVMQNDEEEILSSTRELITAIEKANNLNKEDVVSIIFSCTNDLTKVAPAKAARQLGYVQAGLMSFNEMYVENSLERCVRLMIFCNSNIRQNEVKHIYLKDAKKLRPDLV